MALEALCGVTRRPLNGLFDGKLDEAFEGVEEYEASYPNAVDPMKILASPFVS